MNCRFVKLSFLDKFGQKKIELRENLNIFNTCLITHQG